MLIWFEANLILKTQVWHRIIEKFIRYEKTYTYLYINAYKETRFFDNVSTTVKHCFALIVAVDLKPRFWARILRIFSETVHRMHRNNILHIQVV